MKRFEFLADHNNLNKCKSAIELCHADRIKNLYSKVFFELTGGYQ